MGKRQGAAAPSGSSRAGTTAMETPVAATPAPVAAAAVHAPPARDLSTGAAPPPPSTTKPMSATLDRWFKKAAGELRTRLLYACISIQSDLS